MTRALIIGGTRFIGRHLVREFLDAEYEVTLFNRGRHDNPFADNPAVEHVRGDRTSDAALRDAREAVEPSVVVDTVAYFPGEVRKATRIFSDVDAYVFISSGAAYGPDEIPKREGQTALRSCSEQEAVDDSPETYGARKAEGDRAVFAAAEDGVRAMSVRPTIVYGPDDYTGRFDYWVERVRTNEQVLVPGDGTNIHHLVSVQNVARAIRTVAENGVAGEAYNVGDRRVLTLGDVVGSIASAVGTSVDIVTASRRELALDDLLPTAFPLYNPQPHILSTEKLADSGWEPVAPEDAIATTVAADYQSEQSPGPDRATTEVVLDRLTE